jgi:hypothetical protein
MFVDAGLRRSWCGGRIIFDPRDFLEEFFEDDQSLLRFLRDKESSVCCQGDDRIVELATLVLAEKLFGGEQPHGSRDDRHDHRRKQFLADTMRTLTMEFLEMPGDFFISVILFHLPASEIDINDLLAGIDAAVQQVGNQDRDPALGMVKEKNPHTDRVESFALSG